MHNIFAHYYQSYIGMALLHINIVEVSKCIDYPLLIAHATYQLRMLLYMYIVGKAKHKS